MLFWGFTLLVFHSTSLDKLHLPQHLGALQHYTYLYLHKAFSPTYRCSKKAAGDKIKNLKEFYYWEWLFWSFRDGNIFSEGYSVIVYTEQREWGGWRNAGHRQDIGSRLCSNSPLFLMAPTAHMGILCWIEDSWILALVVKIDEGHILVFKSEKFGQSN